MSIARITRPGLAGISLSVALLWGCVVGEHRMAERAVSDRVRVIRDVERLRRQQAEPVSTPSLHKPSAVPVTAG